MKTTVDIPKASLREVIHHTGARTKCAAIVIAIDHFNRRCRLEKLADRLQGSCPNFMNQETLQQMRKD